MSKLLFIQTPLEEENALDFSTIQFETLKLLHTHESVKNSLRERFEFVMVDEYQDTNTIQELILIELTGKNPNLCVVGDDDQGLYRFRSASIRNILEFREQFPKGVCAEVTLSTNYRSHPGIIEKYDSQPGLSVKEARSEHLELLSVTENYLEETYMIPFEVIAANKYSYIFEDESTQQNHPISKNYLNRTFFSNEVLISLAPFRQNRKPERGVFVAFAEKLETLQTA